MSITRVSATDHITAAQKSPAHKSPAPSTPPSQKPDSIHFSAAALAALGDADRDGDSN